MLALSDVFSQRLAKQLEDLKVPFVDEFEPAMGSSDHIVDAIFGQP
jgi:NAD(P)H-hydrate epimerase